MARGVAEWPELRGALLAGEVTWSAAEIVLRVLAPLAEARAALETDVLESAEKHCVEQPRRLTVRELRQALAEARERGPTPFTAEGSVHPYLLRQPTHVLTLAVSTETGWWLECARRVYECSVSDCAGPVRSNENFVLALLAEARVELEAKDCGSDEALMRRGKYVEQLAHWRQESERRCDLQRQKLEPVDVNEPHSDAAVDEAASALELDARVRALAADLARRDIELGRLATWLQRAEAWRRLGFASETHYVRERMGVSYSHWKVRRRVTRTLGDFSCLEAGLWRGDIGIEAPGLLMRVITVAREQLSKGPRERERWIGE